MEERIIFSEIIGIQDITDILGLFFPESATEFQKAALTLAHLMASLRDAILKGQVISNHMVDVINQLAIIIDGEQYKQR